MSKFTVSVIVAVIAAMLALTLLTACGGETNNAPTEYEVNTDNSEYGLWWYGPDGSDDNVMRASADLPLDYYDPSKPTVVYSHGLKGASESLEPLAPVQADWILSSEGIDISGSYAKQLKDLGYNVAYFRWHKYAVNLMGNEQMIWMTQTTNSALSALKADLPGVSLAGEFAREFITSMQDYQGKPVYFIGHSFGAQMVTAAAYTLYGMQDMGLIPDEGILPERLLLADPYIPYYTMAGETDITYESLAGKDNAEVVADALEYLSGKGVAADLYCAMQMAYRMYGDRPEIDSQLKTNTNYIVMNGLKETYGEPGNIHNVARDWVWCEFIASASGELDGVYPQPVASAEQCSEFGEYSMTGGFDFSQMRIEKVQS